METTQITNRLAEAAARALERCQVADDLTGAVAEAAHILEQVVQLDGTPIEPPGPTYEDQIRAAERERIADVLIKGERERWAIFLPLKRPTAVADWLRFTGATEIPPEGGIPRPFVVIPGMREDGLHGVDGFYVVLWGDTPANDDDFCEDRDDAERVAGELNQGRVA